MIFLNWYIANHDNIASAHAVVTSDNNIKNNFIIVNPLSDTFDDFVDDLLSSDVNLLKGELDFLLMQHLFNSIDLKLINKNETKDDQSLAA